MRLLAREKFDPAERKDQTEIDTEAGTLATLLTATPNLRARFLANPTREAGKSLPPVKYWDYSPPPGWRWLPWYWYGSPFRHRKERARLAKAILEQMTRQVKDQKITAAVNTDSVFEEYFAPIVRVSQRSFTSVYLLSIAAFVAGLGLIGIGTYIAVSPRSGTNSTVVASIFGGSGAISALGAVYAMATQGIREATLDHARVRVVLTAFATQIGQLRAIIERPPGDDTQTIDALIAHAGTLNNSIKTSMEAALIGIPSPVQIAASSSETSPPPGDSTGAEGNSGQGGGVDGARSGGDAGGGRAQRQRPAARRAAVAPARRRWLKLSQNRRTR
jgi:hypothetical protein